jgi:hypothetical protein
MKFVKLVVASLLLVSGLAAAQSKGYAELQYYDEENRNTKADNVKAAVVVGIKTPELWDYSLKMEGSQAELGNGSITTGVEARVRKSFELGSFKPYLGVRLGEKIASDENFSHYAFDYGVKFPLVGALSGDVGGRWRNAFVPSQQFRSSRGHVGVSYALTDKDSIAVRYSQAYGDTSEEKNSWRLAYNRSF